jgi:acyl-CoA dehydrogenase
MLLGEGRGFEISQLRLGPGRIHHCMRSIGAAEKALDLMVKRGVSREAFGKKLAWLGGNVEIISRARIEIEAMRLMVLKAAKAMDVLGNREARIWVHMVKAMVPERVCKIIDQAIQMHGAWACRSTPRWPTCTRSSAPCAWPTARTKCTTWWWAATRSSSPAWCGA